MHWPDFDRTTWGLILAIAALVLAIPLSIIGNLITPHIRDWWALRSVASLQKRIAIGEQELQRLSAIPEITEQEELTLMGIFAIASMLLVVAIIFVWSYGMNLIWGIQAHARTQEQGTNWFVGAMFMFSFLQFNVFQFQFLYRKHLHDKSPTRRRRLEESLNDLRAKFETMKLTNRP